MSRSNRRRAPRSESLAVFAARAGETQSSASSISMTRAAPLARNFGAASKSFCVWRDKVASEIDRLTRRKRVGARQRVRPVAIARTRSAAVWAAAQCGVSDHRRQQRNRRLPAELLRQGDVGEPEREDFRVDRGDGRQISASPLRSRAAAAASGSSAPCDGVAQRVGETLARPRRSAPRHVRRRSTMSPRQISRNATQRAATGDAGVRPDSSRRRTPARCSASRSAASSSRSRASRAQVAAALSARRWRSAPEKARFGAMLSAGARNIGAGAQNVIETRRAPAKNVALARVRPRRRSSLAQRGNGWISGRFCGATGPRRRLRATRRGRRRRATGFKAQASRSRIALAACAES